MRQNILDNLHSLFSGVTDTIKITYYNSKSQEIMKFEMSGHEITEENGTVRIVDDIDTRFFTPKTVTIDPSEVGNVTYENDRAEGSEIHCRNLVINLKDKSRIELETVAFG